MRRGLGRQTRPLARPLSTLRVPARVRTLRWRLAPPFALTQRSIAGRGPVLCPPDGRRPRPHLVRSYLDLNSHSVKRHCPQRNSYVAPQHVHCRRRVRSGGAGTRRRSDNLCQAQARGGRIPLLTLEDLTQISTGWVRTFPEVDRPALRPLCGKLVFRSMFWR